VKNAFKVSEMSSISTLEVAWENRWLWPSVWKYEPYFCWQVAYTNKLELLKWIREEKQCEWDYVPINVAAQKGNLEMVKYCVANECQYYEFACASAAKFGHLDCLKYLHETVKAPWDSYTASGAAENGHLHILEYLVERKYNKYVESACQYAAKFGHLDCLKYLHKTARAPLDYLAVREAHKNNQTECLRYLLDNYGPLPYGWRYEHGELRVPESEVFSSSESESE
jgi:hypothetical protein